MKRKGGVENFSGYVHDYVNNDSLLELIIMMIMH